MTKYYVIFTIKDGVQQDAYVINSMDNDLNYHLDTKGYGDMVITYDVYKTEEEAISERDAHNKFIWFDKWGNKVW